MAIKYCKAKERIRSSNVKEKSNKNDIKNNIGLDKADNKYLL